MPKNTGKIFENEIKSSVPSCFFVYRLRDTGGWNSDSWGEGKEENKPMQYTVTNMCDYFIMAHNTLYPLELKTIKQKSMPFQKVLGANEKKGMKKINQMVDSGQHNSAKVRPYYIFNFSTLNETYALEAFKVKRFIDGEKDKWERHEKCRSSFPVQWVRDNGIHLPQKLKIKYYKYDLSHILERRF